MKRFLLDLRSDSLYSQMCLLLSETSILHRVSLFVSSAGKPSTRRWVQQPLASSYHHFPFAVDTSWVAAQIVKLGPNLCPLTLLILDLYSLRGEAAGQTGLLGWSCRILATGHIRPCRWLSPVFFFSPKFELILSSQEAEG